MTGDPVARLLRHAPHPTEASRRRRDPIMRAINCRADELRARFEAQRVHADEGDENAAAVCDATRDEFAFLVELATALELDAIDRRCQLMAAEARDG